MSSFPVQVRILFTATQGTKGGVMRFLPVIAVSVLMIAPAVEAQAGAAGSAGIARYGFLSGAQSLGNHNL